MFGSRVISDFLIPWTCMRQVRINLHLLWVRAVHTRILGISNLRGIQPWCTTESCMISVCIFRYAQDRVRVWIEFVGHLHWGMICGLVLHMLYNKVSTFESHSGWFFSSFQLSAETILIRLNIFPGDVVILTVRVSSFAGPKNKR